MILKNKAPVQVANDVYWLGSSEAQDFLQANVYLILRKGKGIMIDPGPVTAFKQVLDAVKSLCDVSALSALTISHQDPDITSSLPLWEEAGFEGTIISQWRTGMLVKAFGLQSPMQYINSRTTNPLEEFFSLRFLPLPYLHSPGSMAVYDEKTGILFSGDLFGAMGKHISFYARREDIGRMVYFHKNYMPSKTILREAMEKIETLPGLSMVCPQHGSVIREDLPLFFDALKNIGSAEFQTVRLSEEQPEETTELKRINFELQESLVLNNDEKLKDPVTGLYNKRFFRTFFPVFLENNPSGKIAYFKLDNMKKFNNDFGYEEGDRTIAAFARILWENKPEEYFLLRESGPVLILMIPNTPSDKDYLTVVEKLQNRVRDSEDFIQNMSCSVAAAANSEINNQDSGAQEKMSALIKERLKILDKMGPNSICDAGTEKISTIEKPIVLIIDSDPIATHVFEEYFSSRDFMPICCYNGTKALRMIDLNRPDLIISEIHVPQLDGFRLRQLLMDSSDLRDIPFIFMSHHKTEATVVRAFGMDIHHYLKKPVMLAELYGLAKILTGEKHGN